MAYERNSLLNYDIEVNTRFCIFIELQRPKGESRNIKTEYEIT